MAITFVIYQSQRLGNALKRALQFVGGSK